MRVRKKAENNVHRYPIIGYCPIDNDCGFWVSIRPFYRIWQAVYAIRNTLYYSYSFYGYNLEIYGIIGLFTFIFVFIGIDIAIRFAWTDQSDGCA